MSAFLWTAAIFGYDFTGLMLANGPKRLQHREDHPDVLTWQDPDFQREQPPSLANLPDLFDDRA
jgi:hypothetical protein